MRVLIAVFWAILAMSVGLPGACNAQVIGGESTYEDNFEHVPPRDTEDTSSRQPPAGRDSNVKAGGATGAGRPSDSDGRP